MNRQFDVSKNSGNTITIQINNDKMLCYKIDPNVVSDLIHYHNINANKQVSEIIIENLKHFYDFTESEVEEYTETLKTILEDN